MATKKVYKHPNEEVLNDENVIQSTTKPLKHSLISNTPILQNNANKKNKRSSGKRKRDRKTFDKENEDCDISHSEPPKKKRRKGTRRKSKRKSKRNGKITDNKRRECAKKCEPESRQTKKKSKTIRMAKTKPIKTRTQQQQTKEKGRRHSLSPNNHKANKKKVTLKLGRYFRISRNTEIETEEFIKMVMSDKALVFIGREEITNIVQKLNDEGKIFIVKGLIYRL
eukprot:609343_1